MASNAAVTILRVDQVGWLNNPIQHVGC
jgi:hypothetical protein